MDQYVMRTPILEGVKMHFLKNVATVIALSTLLIACTKEGIVNPASENAESELVSVQVDLQLGFAGKSVTATINGEDHFSALLSELSPLAGPEAAILAYFPRGKNTLHIYGRKLNNGQFSYDDSVEVNFGDAQKYFLGIVLSSDTLVVRVQDTPFLYL